jgi:trk system potassium uptake protein TrkA
LAENLSENPANQITVIDKSSEALKDANEDLDVRCIKGSGLSASTLLSAGIKETDLLIAATSSDEMNMVCTMTGKRLGAKRTIARIRDPEYATELQQLRRDLDLDMVINPEQAVAGEIAKLLEFPAAVDAENFAEGRAQLVCLRVTEDMPIVGLTLALVAKRISADILIGAAVREDTVIIPGGDYKPMAGDDIYAVGSVTGIFRFCAKLGMPVRKVRSVMVVGGGRIAYYLAQYLNDIDAQVKIIEINRARCEVLAEQLSFAHVIHGDGTDDKVLYQENVEGMDGFVAVTGIDEENLMTAMLAKYAGAAKVIAKINRTVYAKMVSKLGLDNVINTKNITANYILRYVRGLQNAAADAVETLYPIAGGKAEAIEFIAGDNDKILDTPLKKLRLLKGVLIAVIVRKGAVIIPHGNDVIRGGDRVVVFTRGRVLSSLDAALSDLPMGVQ